MLLVKLGLYNIVFSPSRLLVRSLLTDLSVSVIHGPQPISTDEIPSHHPSILER